MASDSVFPHVCAAVRKPSLCMIYARRRITMLQEEMMARRRRGERPGGGGGGSMRGHASMASRIPASRQTRMGVMGSESARRSIAEGKLQLDAAWMLHGTRVTKGSSVVTRSHPAFLDSLNVGDRIGVMVDEQGQLRFYSNGNDLGVAAANLPGEGNPARNTAEPLYVVIELRGHVQALKLLPDVRVPRTQQELEKDLLIGVVKSEDVSVAALEAKLAAPGGSEAAALRDRRLRAPAHHLCENERADAEMLR
eukprot:SAG22_NODE_563_length_9067_cov_5.039251_8_plen_252_part_00